MLKLFQVEKNTKVKMKNAIVIQKCAKKTSGAVKIFLTFFDATRETKIVLGHHQKNIAGFNYLKLDVSFRKY